MGYFPTDFMSPSMQNSIPNYFIQEVCYHGVRASTVDFESEDEFKSRRQQQFFLRKRYGATEIRTHDPQIQSQLCLPLDQEFVKNASKIKKFLDEHLKN